MIVTVTYQNRGNVGLGPWALGLGPWDEFASSDRTLPKAHSPMGAIYPVGGWVTDEVETGAAKLCAFAPLGRGCGLSQPGAVGDHRVR